MDIKEAIETLKKAPHFPHEKIGAKEAIDVAVEAMEKQIPKKIGIWNGQASCPCCSKLFGNISDIKRLIAWEMPHCKYCGQKLDWSETE